MRLMSFLLGMTLLASGGCAISESVGSISDSISTSFGSSKSSLESSSPEKSAYRQDVSELTVAYATEGGDLDGFRQSVRQLAESHGITSWETDAWTCASIGQGVKRANYDRNAATHFGETLFGQNHDAVAAYQSGYASVQ